MKSNHRRAFTLVELLVVIAIIALLISILLPALRRAKEAAARTVCMTNHRSFMQAMHLYATDNKQFLPWCNWKNQSGFENVAGWLYDPRLGQEFGQFVYDANPPTQGRNSARSGTLWKYMKNAKAYHCPFDPEEQWRVGAQGPTHVITSYCVNGAVNGYGRPSLWLKLGQFKSDDICMWEQDETISQSFYFNDGANYPYESITVRHGGDRATRKTAGAIFSTFGGSVEWTTGAQFDEWAASNTRNRLWCVPAKISANGR